MGEVGACCRTILPLMLYLLLAVEVRLLPMRHYREDQAVIVSVASQSASYLFKSEDPEASNPDSRNNFCSNKLVCNKVCCVSELVKSTRIFYSSKSSVT